MANEQEKSLESIDKYRYLVQECANSLMLVLAFLCWAVAIIVSHKGKSSVDQIKKRTKLNININKLSAWIISH